jgi:hypothetical protein
VIVAYCAIAFWDHPVQPTEGRTKSLKFDELALDADQLFINDTELVSNLPAELTALLQNAATSCVVTVHVYCKSSDDIESANKALVLCGMIQDKYTQRRKIVVDYTRPDMAGKLRIYTTLQPDESDAHGIKL